MNIMNIFKWAKKHFELVETILQIICALVIMFFSNMYVDGLFVFLLVFLNSRLRLLLWKNDVTDDGELLPLEGIFKRISRR